MAEVSIERKVGEQVIRLTSGVLARQANGSVYAQSGDTAVLTTVCASADDKPGVDFLPLQVEYNEKYYAAGKIPGGFFKREGRPKEREILVSRLIDRPMRPLFSKKLRRDIQIIPTVLSVDQINNPDVLAINCASAAVTISDVPFDGPVGAVRVVYQGERLIINPTLSQGENALLDIVVAGTTAGITMVEGGAREISEELLLEAIEKAREPIAELCMMQSELAGKIGREKFTLDTTEDPLESYARREELIAHATPRIEEICFVKGKHNRAEKLRSLHTSILTDWLGEECEEEEISIVEGLLEEIETSIVRASILEKQRRTDDRGPQDIRSIECAVGMLPRAHGSALFTRGETQSLAVITLGTIEDEQIRDDIAGDRRESFMLHYNFPPFSVGETGRLATGRREIGHGELAHRALRAVTPTKDTFPYTIRVVSEILESNGSSSMATVCAGSLSMMNAGIPTTKPVAGIAMGLVSDGEQYVILSDILGIEDHLGDMDFKVAGTKDGITAFQMDIKIKNINSAILKEALQQAKEGRHHILDTMAATISAPQGDLSQYAPRIINFSVDPEVLGILIGPGGKTVKAINEKYNVSTNIDDSGMITVYCSQPNDGENAKEAFLKLLEEPEVGKIYEGTVKRIVDFGAFIEFLPGKEGLCHISKMSKTRIANVEDVLSFNQNTSVQIIEIDKMGRVNLCLVDDNGAPISNSAPRQFNTSKPRENNNRRRDRRN